MSDIAELHVTVEMSDDFELGARTEATLAELVEPLHSEHADEVAEFGVPPRMRSFSFSLTPRPGGNDTWAVKWKVTPSRTRTNE